MAELEPAHQKWAQLDYNWQFGRQKMFGDRKNSDTFLELGKNLSKLVRSVRISNFIVNCG